MINAIFKIGYGEDDAATEHLFAERHEPTLAMRNDEKNRPIKVVRIFHFAAVRKLFSRCN